ncbi:cuticle protein 1-like [Cydia amplana]|uniref:cuticle protein 1-like n=1 Tax=Cydia amplana TaxID=1869771 RepID=UPI002FE6AEC4
MFTKVLLVCAVAAVAAGIEYPPGINPALCPNYPDCDMELLARYGPQPIPIPEFELPYARMVYAAPYPIPAPIPAPIPVPFAAPITEEPAAPLYPADVDPASCPNYPYCA